MKLNKRGQGLSVNAIILIVLGVVVLAVLVVGFTVGWQKILPFVSTNNVDTLVTTCGIACSTNSQFGFCINKRDLKAGDVSIKDVTCNYLAEEQKKYGVASCGSICEDIAILVKNTDTKIESQSVNIENQAEFSKTDNSIFCGLEDQSKGKTVYVLNKANDALLSLECKVIPRP